MENSILKSRAALALNEILATDHVDYHSFERSRLCFYIQDYHNDIEKEVVLALAPEWEEIKNYDRLSFFKRLLNGIEPRCARPPSALQLCSASRSC